MPYNTNIPGQVSEYELRAIEAVAGLLPEKGHMVEVGSLFGRSSWAWAKSCDASVTVHCIDPWQGNEGVRTMEEMYKVKYGIEGFRKFTADCPNIEAHQGFSPKEFKNWSQQLDLYFEDAVHVDPILSENIDFWASKLKPSGILCGDDFRPRFPDVCAAAERMAIKLGRRLQKVDFFWCLLPDESTLKGAGRVARILDDIALECEQAKLAKGVLISVRPVKTLHELVGQGPHMLDLLVTNDGAKPLPLDENGSISLVAVAQPSDEKVKPWTAGVLPLKQLKPDIPNKATMSLDMAQMASGTADIALSLKVREDGLEKEIAGTVIRGIKVSPAPDLAAIGDYVVRDANASELLPSVGLRLDDVVHAYRWILGREPENMSKLKSHSELAKYNPKRLRMNLLNSAEFRGHLRAAGLAGNNADGDMLDLRPFAPQTEPPKRLVFIHLPKTGGTTVHYHLQKGYEGGDICGLRHNDLLEEPAHKLAGFQFYSGHFDARLLHLIPTASLVTVHRDPGERLYSLYRHLRFTTPDRQLAGNHDLAELAHSKGFEAFLDEASQRNPGTVDNAYVRAFGGTLPIARWERSADPEWIKRFGAPSEGEWDAMVERAAAVLSMPNVTILSFSRLSAELESFCSRLGLPQTEPIRHLKNSTLITNETVGFSPIEIEPYAPNPTLERLTRYDRQLMTRIRRGA